MESRAIEILLIEDNEGDAELTIRALKKKNIRNRIIHLKDGEEALDYIFNRVDNNSFANHKRPTLILLDLKMPKVNGLEVLKRIKENNHTKSIPVVVLTSSKNDPDIKVCYELGANSYIIKPVRFEDFMDMIGTLGIHWLLLNQSPS